MATPGSGGTIAVSVSWNGATEVASWRVLAGASRRARAGRDRRQGGLSDDDRGASGAGPYVAVQALNSAGDVIGTSATVKD